ncbi:MAG: glycosyltransferase family 8 protein [Rickettsiales bacterium]|jgi:lipopolysaccharide biosynthesis glycosyltransferase|nr:glycosyltransferase family 8 protein [Rickettsiales bacterium]
MFEEKTQVVEREREREREVVSVFLTSDSNYIHYVATTIASICYSSINSNTFIKFYILADNVSLFRKKQVEELKNKFDNFDIVWADLSQKDKDFIYQAYMKDDKRDSYLKNISNYSRFLLPTIFSEVKKAIYLDTDIIVYGNIAELYNHDLEGYIIGAVGDIGIFSGWEKSIMLKHYLKQEHLYFNAGVLLIDCDKWREQCIFNKIVECDKEIMKVKIHHSQCPLNKCFEMNYKILPLKYNQINHGGICGNKPLIDRAPSTFLDYFSDEEVFIKHFTGIKPDKYCNDSNISTFFIDDIYIKDFFFVAKMTPFYDEMLGMFNRATIHNRLDIKLFRIIPLLKIKRYGNRMKVYLFGFLPVLKINIK